MCTVLWSAWDVGCVTNFFPLQKHPRTLFQIPKTAVSTVPLEQQTAHVLSGMPPHHFTKTKQKTGAMKREVVSNHHPLTTDVHSQFHVVMGTVWTVTQGSFKSESNQEKKKKTDETLRLFKIPHPNRSWWAGALSRSESEHRCSDFCTLKKKKERQKEKRSRFVLQAISCHSAHTLHS